MELREIAAFIQVAQLKSFSKAAKQLGYSQAAVTIQIKQLEQELGIRDYEVLPGNLLRLYDRLDRPQTVTAALMGAGVALIGAENKNANLEDYFLGLIGGVRHG